MVLGKAKRPPKSFSLVKWRLLNSTCFFYGLSGILLHFSWCYFMQNHVRVLTTLTCSLCQKLGPRGKKCGASLSCCYGIQTWDKTTHWSGWKCPLLLIVTHINLLPAEYTGIPSLIILDVRKCVWHRGTALLQAVFKRSTCLFSLMWIFFNFRHAPSSNRACRVCKMPSATANGLSQFACLKLWTK